LPSHIVLIVVVIAVSLSGCCALYPCHPVTSIYGNVVSQSSGITIPSAFLSLYGNKFSSSQNGCFKFYSADAIPFVLNASANEFKPVESPAEAGFYNVTISLAPKTSGSASIINWSSVSEEEFNSAPPCN